MSEELPPEVNHLFETKEWQARLAAARESRERILAAKREAGSQGSLTPPGRLSLGPLTDAAGSGGGPTSGRAEPREAAESSPSVPDVPVLRDEARLPVPAADEPGPDRPARRDASAGPAPLPAAAASEPRPSMAVKPLPSHLSPVRVRPGASGLVALRPAGKGGRPGWAGHRGTPPRRWPGVRRALGTAAVFAAGFALASLDPLALLWPTPAPIAGPGAAAPPEPLVALPSSPAPAGEPVLAETAVPATPPPSAPTPDPFAGPIPEIVRVFFHVPPGLEEAGIAAIADLEQLGIPVVGPRVVDVTILQTHVRYFYKADAAAAGQLGAFLGGPAKDFTAFRPAPAPGTIEVWVSRDQVLTRSAGR